MSNAPPSPDLPQDPQLAETIGPDGPFEESTEPGPGVDRLLEECLEQFLELGTYASPEALRGLLPDASRETRRYLLIELIKMDMATVVEETDRSVPKIDSYLTHFKDLLHADDVPIDLLMEEIQLRKQQGEDLSVEEYVDRFPAHAEFVGELLGQRLSQSPEATAAVQSRSRPPQLEIGQSLDDFVIVQTLGSGAFANVYLARQVSMSRVVALKVSRGTGDEPQALAQLDHPNIVRVFDQRVTETPPSHLLYMQFQPGGTLADVVKIVRQTPRESRSGAMLLEAIDRSLLRTAQAVPERSTLREWLRTAPWPMTVAWLGIQLARALESAHDCNVMHRDVKPANVLLSAEGVPKLADFNVSFAGVAGRAGAASNFGGSIGYMSPEHLRAISAVGFEEVEEVGPRADLYSLAILLWEVWQGHRPFEVNDSPTSWTDAVAQQLKARSEPLESVTDNQDAISRLLETTLRAALREQSDERISSGSEFAAKLKLALHPEAARLFDPEDGTWQRWLSRRSPWWIAALVILVPNAIAGVFGRIYNQVDSLRPLLDIGETKSTFNLVSNSINSVAFPLAVVLVLYYTRDVVRGLKTAESDHPSEEHLFSALQLPHRAAVIGGILWCVAAVLYPLILSILFEQFGMREVLHFFLSHVICGGVAAIYPFFGLTIYATTVLYPRMIRSTLHDARFDERMERLMLRAERYLFLACLVPLIGASLLLMRNEDQARWVILIAIALTGIGSIAAFSAYRLIARQCSQMAKMLSNRKDSVMPES
ncbi:MAG: serine/threonine-protein kinase [Planctomycetota bacterium]